MEIFIIHYVCYQYYTIKPQYGKCTRINTWICVYIKWNIKKCWNWLIFRIRTTEQSKLMLATMTWWNECRLENFIFCRSKRDIFVLQWFFGTTATVPQSHDPPPDNCLLGRPTRLFRAEGCEKDPFHTLRRSSISISLITKRQFNRAFILKFFENTKVINTFDFLLVLRSKMNKKTSLVEFSLY